MAMGRKRKRHQDTMWVAASDLPKSPGHPFYKRLNQVLAANSFDAFVEAACRRFYAEKLGRPSLQPGRYFRLMLLGYFEGLGAERAMAWRAADSLAIRSFLGLELDEAAPDHSTISRTRRLIDVETHQRVFAWVLERLAKGGLLVGKTIGIDATTLEANAAMRSIVRRDTGASYEEFLKGLAKASGIKTPTREALARLDRRRKKKASNDDWTSPSDPDAKITKMKDGRTHLAHKAEHAVDMATGAIVAVTVQGADEGDTTTIENTLEEAEGQLDAVMEKTDKVHPDGLSEVVADKGYHSDRTLVALEDQGLRSYVSEPDRGRRKWKDDVDAQQALYANRRRIRGERGKGLQRARGELIERSFAHLYETGDMRRTHLRGHTNILKRLLIHAAGFNLGLVMRTSIGVGTPRGLQGALQVLLASLTRIATMLGAVLGDFTIDFRLNPLRTRTTEIHMQGSRPMALATGC
ncbi:MAG TPA: transposase [Solirubrobacteraceae bacterium]|nr:transposase [Solirubrobacteraceae bacterium]